METMTTDYDQLDVGYLTVAEVAALLRVSKMSIYRFMERGTLRAVRLGRDFRIPEPEVRAWLARSATGTE